MPNSSPTLVGTVLAATLVANWYLSSANDRTKDSLVGRSLLLEDDLKRRLTVLHSRFRDRLAPVPGISAAEELDEELGERESFEQEQWRRVLDAEWDAISSRFRQLYRARQTSRTCCFFASLLAYCNIVMSVVSLLILGVGVFWPTWGGWVNNLLPFVCIGLGTSTVLLLIFVLAGKTRDRKLEGVLLEGE